MIHSGNQFSLCFFTVLELQNCNISYDFEQTSSNPGICTDSIFADPSCIIGEDFDVDDTDDHLAEINTNFDDKKFFDDEKGNLLHAFTVLCVSQPSNIFFKFTNLKILFLYFKDQEEVGSMNVDAAQPEIVRGENNFHKYSLLWIFCSHSLYLKIKLIYIASSNFS